MACMQAALQHWLATYKLPTVNSFATAEPLGRAFATQLIEETHESWRALVAERGGLAVVSKQTDEVTMDKGER